MALRQMGIARMGPYRPKLGVNEGGKTGRPKLLHNGTGHGLTGGGGMNSKGSAGGGIKIKAEFTPMKRQLRKSKYASNKHNAMKINEREKNRAKNADKKTRTVGGPVMNPHPVGNFMYGNNQWGYINPKGLVDWTSQKPVAGRPVIGMDKALPYLNRTPNGMTVAKQFLGKAKAAPAAYFDPIYYRMMAQANLERDTANIGFQDQQNQVNHEYGVSNAGLQDSYATSSGEMTAGLGGANLAGSGIANANMGDLAAKLQQAVDQNKAQKKLSDDEVTHGLQNVTTGYGVEKNIQNSAARERWLSTHQGMKLPKSQNGTTFKEGGITYKQDANGIRQTWTPAAAKPKPKFPGAKTFTNQKTGKVTNIKGK